MSNQCTIDVCDCDGNLPFDSTCDWNEKWELYRAAGMERAWGSGMEWGKNFSKALGPGGDGPVQLSNSNSFLPRQFHSNTPVIHFGIHIPLIK